MAEATELILNPHGNHNRDGRQWIAVQRRCMRELAPANVTLVESVPEAAEAARQAAMKGYEKIVSVGETATAHGVVNGIMRLAESHRHRLKVGFLSFGRPDLWSRTLDLPRRLDRQLELLSAGNTLPFDVGCVESHEFNGQRGTHYFLNGACFGVPGRLRHDWRDPNTHLLQTLPRMAEALRAAMSEQGSYVRMESLGSVLYEGSCAMAMLMGGRYYPAFGRVAPQADPTDGRLELAWLGGGPWWQTLLKLAGLWMGDWRPTVPGLQWQSVEQLRAVSMNGPVHVEVDGQPAGRLPATFSVARRSLPVIVAPVAIKLRKPKFKQVESLSNGRLVGNIKSAAGL